MYTPDDFIIYLRKSRSDNPDTSIDEVLAKHEEQLQDFLQNEFAFQLPEAQIFREVVSGETIADRPIMKRVLQLLESNTIKGVVVIDPQRLSRGDLEDCGKITNAFRYTNTLILTPPKTYDLANEYDRKFFEMELTRGNDYLEYTKKILNRGRIASVKRGNFIGSVAPYGYKKVQCGTGKDTYFTLEIIPDEAEALRLMFHLFVNEFYGFSKIARYLDSTGIKPRKAAHWSAAAIKDMLGNPVYIGKIRWNWRKVEKRIVGGEIVKTRPKSAADTWIYVDGRHEAIIDDTTFQAALERRGKNPCIRKDRSLINPFAGLLVCGTCGRNMSYKNFGGRSTPPVLICNDQSYCHTRSLSYEDLVQTVADTLDKTIKEFQVLLENSADASAAMHNDMLKRMEIELQKLKDKDARQKDALDDGIYTKDEYLMRNAKVQEQIESVQNSIAQFKSTTPVTIDYQDKIVRFSQCLDYLYRDDISADHKNALLKECIRKITYYSQSESKPGIGRFVPNVFDLKIELIL